MPGTQQVINKHGSHLPSLGSFFYEMLVSAHHLSVCLCLFVSAIKVEVPGTRSCDEDSVG